MANAGTPNGPQGVNQCLQLFDRWERQQWTVRELEPGQDRAGWEALPAPIRNQLRANMIQFFIGEFAVTETLAPLAQAAPELEAQLFLCTQLADEARHALFFFNYLAMVEGPQGPPGAKLRSAWEEASAGQTELFDQRLRAFTDRVRLDPADIGSWYEAITLYHFVLEGVLATAGQRIMLRLAKQFGSLPVFVAGLENVARDESRHVSFGMEALRQGVEQGRGPAILAVIEASIAPLVEMTVQPHKPAPTLALKGDATYFVYAWDLTRRTLRKRLGALGLGDYVDPLDRSWQEAVGRMLDDYERLHGEPHPAGAMWSCSWTTPSPNPPS